jgi:hypothetical protein
MEEGGVRMCRGCPSFAGRSKYASERKTTFSKRETPSSLIPRCHSPTEESVGNHALRSSLSCFELNFLWLPEF